MPPPPPDPEDAAKLAGLHYVSDDRPGIRRRRSGRGFSYSTPSGERIADPEQLRWIRSLAVPPAWTDVWISPVRNGHILATGRDARGRKQYRYHPRWREVRDESKYTRLIEFGGLLPRIRERIDADLARPALSREKVLAAVVRLLEVTFLRVGNEEYARLNRSFGLTTLRNRHVRVEGSRIRFRFRGKSGKVNEVGLRDRRLAGVLRRLQELPGQELFEYVDGEGELQAISSGDVNAYLREITGQDITAKEFRTWAGTVLAYRALRGLVPASQTEAKRNVVATIRDVAAKLGNTPAVTRGSYVDPGVIEAYLGGELVAGRNAPSADGGRPLAGSQAAGRPEVAIAPPGSDPDEAAAVLEFLRGRVRAADGGQQTRL
jgi:DNA topoisomerase-1